METEVKFRELPEKVQNFLRHKRFYPCNIWFESDTVDDEWIHRLPEWSQATDEERLAYAEWRYPVGTKFKSVFSNEIDIIKTVFVSVLTDGDVDSDCELEDGRIIYDHFNNKWAEIISEPEEKPLFKVGDRPKWTPELIKQLPHGTVLECAYQPEDIFTYEGQEINRDLSLDLHVLFSGVDHFFEYKNGNRYAKILSLPDEKPMPGESINKYRKRVIGLGPIKEASPSAQQEFVKANPGMQHVEEPKAGDMVEASNGSFMTTLVEGRFTGGQSEDGSFLVECHGAILKFKYIRLPQKSEVESKAKEIVKYYNSPVSTEFYNPGEEREKQIALTAIKWGQANPSKI